MNRKIIIAVAAGILLVTRSVTAQSAFQNLNFEQANPVIDPNSVYYPWAVTAASALPGWTVLFGNIPQSDAWQNVVSTGSVNVGILGPNYPAAGSTPGFAPGTIDGKYSVLLQWGGDQSNGQIVSASIAQTGRVPPTAQSLQFKVWQSYEAVFSVSFAGNTLSPVVLGSGANYTLYGVSMSSYAGQTGTLEFSALEDGFGASNVGLDDIAFSAQAVPEPNPFILTEIAGIIFALRRFWRR